MHTNDKGNVSMLNLNHNYRFKALEDIEPISTKTNQPWSNSFSFKPPCVIKEFMMIKIVNVDSKSIKHLLDLQQQGYPTPILHNITICIAQLVLSMDVNSSQVKYTNLTLLIMNLIVFLSSWFICSFHLPTNSHKPMFLGTYQCLKT